VPGLEDETCELLVKAEGSNIYGPTCDQIVCGGRSVVKCASNDCINCPCPRHLTICEKCGQYFCYSPYSPVWTCFSEHRLVDNCDDNALEIPLGKLTRAFGSRENHDLHNFVRHDSDGLGHPLPEDVCVNLGVAVAHLKSVVPEYGEDVVIARDMRSRQRRTRTQNVRRAARRLGILVSPPSGVRVPQLAPHRQSTIRLVTGALVVRNWTGTWHYRELTEMLAIMGIFKNIDFIRDRVEYLRRSNPSTFTRIQSFASAIRKAV
jgi:hypothetical protein